MDAVVTPTGDLVEIEEQVAPDQVPATVLGAVRKLSGEGAALFCEKKTSILYEVKFRKDDQRHEILYAPDGRVMEKAVEKVEKAGDDKDD